MFSNEIIHFWEHRGIRRKKKSLKMYRAQMEVLFPINNQRMFFPHRYNIVADEGSDLKNVERDMHVCSY